MGQRVRWGVMVCDRVARMQVVPVILRYPNAGLQAVTTRDAAKLCEFRALYGELVPRGSYDALIRNPAVDTVHLSLPNTPPPRVSHSRHAHSGSHPGKGPLNTDRHSADQPDF